MSNYLNAFALVNAGGIKAQIYLMGKESTYTPFNTQALTVILNSNNEPQFAKVGLGELDTTLHICPAARLFAQGEYDYCVKNAEGVNVSAQRVR